MERLTNRYVAAALVCVLLLLVLAVYQGIDAHREVTKTAEAHYSGQLDTMRKLVDDRYRDFEMDVRGMGNGILVESNPDDYENVVRAYLRNLNDSHGMMIEDAGVWQEGDGFVIRIGRENSEPVKGIADRSQKVIVHEKKYFEHDDGRLTVFMPLHDRGSASRGQVWVTIRIKDLIGQYDGYFKLSEAGYLWYMEDKNKPVFISERLSGGAEIEKMNLPQTFYDRVSLGLDGKTTNLMITSQGRYWMVTSYVVIHVGGIDIPMGVSHVTRELAWKVDLKLLAISMIMVAIVGVLVFTFRRIIATEIETKKSVVKAVESFNRLVESIPAGVILSRTNGEIKYINNAAKRLTGCYDSEGLSIGDICHTESIGNLQSHSVRRDGELYPVAMAIESIDLDNEPMQVYSFVDISHIEEARLLSEASNRTKSEFLTNISHEIKTPMNGILASAQILSSMPMDDDQADLVDIITTSSDQLLGIINQILEHSKIESGKLELKLKPYDIRLQLENLQEMFHIKAKNKGLKLIFDISPSLPDLIIQDEIRIQQILNNLVNNAVKFTENGHVWVQVAYARPYGHSPQLIVQVGDTGVGIPKTQQTMIFEPFIQLDGSLKRNFGGTGLGMSIVKDLLDMMQGTIQVESPNPLVRGENGTLFRIQIPMTLQDEEAASVIEGGLNADSTPRLAVVVGIDGLINESLKHLLQKLSWEVICTDSLDDLVSIVSTNIGRIDKYILLTGMDSVFDKQTQDLIYTLDRRGASKLELPHAIGIHFSDVNRIEDDTQGNYQMTRLKYPVRLKSLESVLE